MSVEKSSGKIDQLQIFTITLALTLGTALISKGEFTLEKSWLAIALAGTLAAIYTILLRIWQIYFAQMTLYQIFEYTFGRAICRLLIFAYGTAFLALTFRCLWEMVYFWHNLGMEQTSLLIFAAVLAICLVAFGESGAVAVCRLSILVVIPSIIMLIFNLLLSLGSGDMENLLPISYQFIVSDQNLSQFALAVIADFATIFAGIFVVLPYFFLVENGKKSSKTIFFAVIVATAVYLMFTLGQKIVLGDSLELYDYPILQVFRLTEIGNSFSRFEVLGSSLLIFLASIYLAVTFVAAKICFSQLWNVKKSWHLTSAMAMSIFATFALSTEKYYQIIYLIFDYFSYLMLTTSLIIPAVTLYFARRKFIKVHKNIINRHRNKI